MCLSNRAAYRCVVWLKSVYHQYNLGHILLLASYFTFIIISAAAFFLIESYNSNTFRRKWNLERTDDRNDFVMNTLIPEIFNNSRLLVYIHDSKSQYLRSIVSERLQQYERQLKLRPPLPTLPCTFANSLVFVFSTITTIGYGYIYPVTDEGRLLSIGVSLFGIPFTIIVIKDLAYLLAVLLNYPCKVLEKLWAMFRFCTLRPVDENELEQKLHGSTGERKDYRLSNTDRLLAIPVTVAVLSVAGWTFVGCAIVHLYMPKTDTSVALYFIFNSLATIGVGDVEPGENPVVLLLLFAYLVIGLSIISLFINLLHTKFSQAYWLPGKMYIPLRYQIHPCEHSRAIASLESLGEGILSDCPVNHFTTLGILQTDDKCPLIGINKREMAFVDAVVQSDEHRPSQIRTQRGTSPEAVLLDGGREGQSQDDVHALIVETYGARPARLITSREAREML